MSLVNMHDNHSTQREIKRKKEKETQKTREKEREERESMMQMTCEGPAALERSLVRQDSAHHAIARWGAVAGLKCLRSRCSFSAFTRAEIEKSWKSQIHQIHLESSKWEGHWNFRKDASCNPEPR